MFATLILTALASAAILVRADPTPNTPAPNDVYIEGQPCQIAWDVDPTGTWKNMSIELMTGDNFNMVYLTTVGTVDGTDSTKTTYSYTCPQVTPYSPIYFYQFSSPASANVTWTGRFTITDKASDVVPPSQSTQPDGEAIPWGTGQLVNYTASVAPPSGATSAVSATGTALGTPSGTNPVTATPVAPTTTSGTPAVVVLTSTMSPTSSSVAPPTSSNAATGVTSAKVLIIQTCAILGVSALGFSLLL